MGWDNFSESQTPGGRMFREWLKKRVNEEMNPAGAGAEQPSDVQNTNDPKELARRKAVNNIATTMMKKNPQLKPGATNQQQVANATQTDPTLAKADPETQQAVNSFFLKK